MRRTHPILIVPVLTLVATLVAAVVTATVAPAGALAPAPTPRDEVSPFDIEIGIGGDLLDALFNGDDDNGDGDEDSDDHEGDPFLARLVEALAELLESDAVEEVVEVLAELVEDGLTETVVDTRDAVLDVVDEVNALICTVRQRLANPSTPPTC